MREILAYQIKGLRDSWHNGLSGEALRSVIVFPLLILLSFAVCLAFPTLRESLLSYVLASMDGTGAIRDDGTLSALALFSNNLRATSFIMAYGLIPFIPLPAMALGVNAMVIGVTAAWYFTEGYSMLGFLASVLPHGLLEFPALILAFAVGLFACGQITRRLFRKDENALHLWDCLVLMSRMLLLVLIPLLAAAAMIEAYITPVIASLFF